MDDRYAVGKLIEALSFGNIYEAEDTLIQRKVQIIRYPIPTHRSEEEWKEAFHSASAELAVIKHPGLPIIYNHGIDEEGPFTIRQTVDCKILNQRLIEGGPLGEFETWELAMQMLEIHDAAKTSGNFHGALNADHIGLTPRPSGHSIYSITDYGLAEICNRMHDSQTDYHGAPYLIAPEQAKAKPVNEISQIYSIGQLIYHALTGGHPWIQSSLQDIVDNQKNNPLPLVSEYNPNVSEDVAQWLNTMISFDPAKRFQSFEEAAENLPKPTQSAPVPIHATAAVYNVPATAEPAEEHHSAAELFALQQQALKEKQLEKRAALLKNPLVLGGAAALIVLLIIIIAMSGGDDKKLTDEAFLKTSTAATNTTANELPSYGLVAYLNFENNSLTSSTQSKLQLSALNAQPLFANGRTGKGLVLDATHYYQLPVARTALGKGKSDYTVSFWVLTSDRSSKSLVGHSEQGWKGSQEKLWEPQNAKIIHGIWNMVTIVHSSNNDQISIYLDGNLIDTAASESESFDELPYIFLGCDSKEKNLHNTPVVVDDFAVWSRALSGQEIRDIHGL